MELIRIKPTAFPHHIAWAQKMQSQKNEIWKLESCDLLAQWINHLACLLGRWLVPPKPSATKTWYQTFQEKLPHHFTPSYWKNNKPFILTLYSIIGINIILMVQRAYYFKDFSMLNGYTPNPFYMISRACGRFPRICLIHLFWCKFE